MANNYQQFSKMIPVESVEQADWITAQLDNTGEGENGACCSYENEGGTGGIWVYAEESGDIDALVSVVAEAQTRFKLTHPWILTWADTCSKPRCDEFSGGAVAVYRGAVKWFAPSFLADKWVAQKRKAEKKKR